jgi:response regulator RpfG family c-di-GMP phosphodiesterase
MGMTAAEADTAELGGALMNVGKLFVPVPLLTKTGTLEQEETSQFAEGAARWLEILTRAPLDLPLLPVLQDAHRIARGEAVGGSGHGRIAYINVAANKAVALTSPRAYRMAHPPQEALEILQKSRPRFPDAIITAMTDLMANVK